MAERFSNTKDMNAGRGTEREQQSPYLNTGITLAHNLKIRSQSISSPTKQNVRKGCFEMK